MDKIITLAGRSDKGVFSFVIDAERQHLEKTAAEYHPTIASYINQARPIPGRTQILLTALGASEFWGANANFDAFPEAALAHEGSDYGYKTFEQYARVFKHHLNRPDSQSYGSVVLAVYNHVFHRVELIISLDNAAAPDIVDMHERGENVSWSMGTKVPFDQCQHPNAEIITPAGVRPISEISIGDLVLTHKNRFRAVTRTFKSHAPAKMIRFRATGDMHEALVTPEHPMYALRREAVFNGNRRHYDFQALKQAPDWLPARDVGDKDYLLRAVPGCGTAEVDPKIAYLLGHYLGDGHLVFDTKGHDKTRPMAVIFTTFLGDRDTIVRRLVDYAMDLGWDVGVRTNSSVRTTGAVVRAITTTIRNRDFARMCNDIYGVKSDKHVPDDVLTWNAEAIKHFLGGYVDADGCFRKHSSKNPDAGGTLTTTSVIERLSRGMQTLFHMVGMSASIRQDAIGKTNGTWTASKFGYVLNVAKSHAEKLRGYSVKIQTTTKFEGRGPVNFFFEYGGVKYWAMRVREKEEIFSPCPEVFNLSVAEDESYVADGFVTHNCSICGHRAPTRKEYCDHARFSLGRIDPESGKLVYVINTMPRFFDISYVLIGADRIAKSLMKVASHAGPARIIGSAEAAEKMAATLKAATIEKEVPAADPPGSSQLASDVARSIMEVKAREEPLPRATLDSLSQFPLPKILSTLAVLGILPKPQEFQRLVLVSLGKGAMADELDGCNCSFDPAGVAPAPPRVEEAMGLSARNFSPEIMEILRPFMAERSNVAPHLGPRLVVMVKRANCKGGLPTFLKVGNDTARTSSKNFAPVASFAAATPVLGLTAAMYATFEKRASAEAVAGIDRLIVEHPALATALGLTILSIFRHGLAIGGARQTMGNYTPGDQFADSDVSSVFARIERLKQKPYMKVASSASSPAQRLYLGMPAAFMASGSLQKQRENSPHDEKRAADKFVRAHPEVMSGLCTADALLTVDDGKFGKTASPYSRALSAATKEMPGHFSFHKVASARDFLKDPSFQCPSQVKGALFDQAALETSLKVLGDSK